MRNKLKKLVLLLMALCLLISMRAASTEVKAADKVELSETKLTLRVGDTEWLSFDNAWDKTVTWNSSKKDVVTVEAHEEYSSYAKIHAKKKGTANITAKIGNKKYTCTVTVKKFALSNTKGKNAKDVKALKAIIKKQNLQGAMLPTDMDLDPSASGDYCGYIWDKKGNLIAICWGARGLQGSLSLKEFSLLESFFCWDNELSSLDVSKNTALTVLICSGNELRNLDVGECTALAFLECSHNSLSSLDVSECTALEELACSGNELSSLDVSKNIALTWLSCDRNELSSLNVSKNTALFSLNCSNNSLSSLDVSGCTALTYLICDDNVKVTGY